MMESRVTTPFGTTSTADQVLAGVAVTGRRAIVAGASSGIGKETARALAAAGAEVTLAVRTLRPGVRLLRRSPIRPAAARCMWRR